MRTSLVWAGPKVVGLLAHRSVDPLAKKVDVAVVSRVLLDHVHQHPAQRDGSPPGLVACDAEIGRLPPLAWIHLRAGLGVSVRIASPHAP